MSLKIAAGDFLHFTTIFQIYIRGEVVEVAIKLLLGLVVILIGAELFTNGIEWLGFNLGLSEGAVGSFLAAVGTALPESIIPVVAIVFGKSADTAHIGIGAILGAPFMLGTLVFFVTGLSARCFFWRGPEVYNLDVNTQIIMRDLIFFVVMYSFALGASCTSLAIIRKIIALFLVLGYITYVLITLNSGQQVSNNNLKPLYFCFWRQPGQMLILTQLFSALLTIVWGANYFVEGIRYLSQGLGMPSLIVALIIAPIATELPEKFNSIIWLSQKKDTLALGNITGAMVFQSSIIPVFGILATPWQLNGISLLSGVLVISSSLLLILNVFITKRLSPSFLIFNGIFYLIFIGFVYWGMCAYGC